MGLFDRFKRFVSRGYQDTKPKKKRLRDRSKRGYKGSETSTKRKLRRLPRSNNKRNKKYLFSLRISKNVIEEFKDFCKVKGYHVNEILEIYMRGVLMKNSVDKVKVRVKKARSS